MALAYYNEKNIVNATSTVMVGETAYQIEHEVTSTETEGCTQIKSYVYTDDSAGNRRCLGSASMLKAGSSMSVSLKNTPMSGQAAIVARLYEDIIEIISKKESYGTE